MKTSVILCTYNGKEYILEQLDSLKNQSLQPDEVIITDDKSTDETATIIKDYIKQYKLDNWKLSINEENKGFRKNFMDSIRECSGEYLFLCDQDDIWNQDKISSMTKAMDENPKIDLLVSSLTYLRDGGLHQHLI